MVVHRTLLFLHEDGVENAKLRDSFHEQGYSLVSVNLDDFSPLALPETIPAGILAKVSPENLLFVEKIQHIVEFYQVFDIPVLGLLSSTLPVEIDVFDSVLLEPAYVDQIVLRMGGLIRLRQMEREINLRLKTLEKDFNLQPNLPSPSKQSRFNILFIGKASPEFMVIINALQKRNVNVVAAFTSFTAFEYLYEQTFDAVVINGLGTIEPAKTIVETMRKNALLYHVPTLMLIDRDTFSEHDFFFLKGLNDVIDAKSAPEQISSRIIEQANFYRLHERLKFEFGGLGGQDCTYPGTDLYSKTFFNAHIARLAQDCRRRNQPLSLSLIRVKPNKTYKKSETDTAYSEVGKIIKNLLRMQDTVARMEPNLFSIAFPGQTTAELKPVADRLSAVLNCASIGTDEFGAPLKLSFELALHALTEPETSQNVA